MCKTISSKAHNSSRSRHWLVVAAMDCDSKPVLFCKRIQRLHHLTIQSSRMHCKDHIKTKAQGPDNESTEFGELSPRGHPLQSIGVYDHVLLEMQGACKKIFSTSISRIRRMMTCLLFARYWRRPSWEWTMRPYNIRATRKYGYNVCTLQTRSSCYGLWCCEETQRLMSCNKAREGFLDFVKGWQIPMVAI